MRCFVAVWPSAEVLDALATLPRPATPHARWSTRQQWHVTLRFFGELGDRDVARAEELLATVARKTRGPILVTGGPATRFLGRGLIVWPVAGLDELAGAVERATRRLGKPPAHRPFRGHLTIARGSAGADLRHAGELLTPLSSSWEVSSLSLVESHLNPEGARYRDVASFELSGCGSPDL